MVLVHSEHTRLTLGALATAAGHRGDELRDGIGASFVVVGAAALAATLTRPGAAGGLALAAVAAGGGAALVGALA